LPRWCNNNGIAGARLHPQVEAVRRERVALDVVPLHRLTVTEARRRDEFELRQRPAPDPSPVRVDDLEIPGPDGPLAARVYRPPDAPVPSPAFLWFYGGGWVLGSLDAGDSVCRTLAERTPCTVLAASYRRAPEHPFPAAAEDAYAAFAWLGEHAGELGLDPARLAIGGASAGANLAAVAARLAGERGARPPALQVLVYPVTDYLPDTQSMRECVDSTFFGAADVAWCWQNYLADPRDAADPRAAPMRAPDLTGLPPAIVITAEADPLRDEGEAYAARLAASGVEVETVRYDGLVHGFFSLTEVYDAAADAQARVSAALARAFHSRLGAGDPHRR
jgi:acetyl esterase